MKYLMLVRNPRGDVIPADADLNPTAWVEQATAAGQRILGERLRPAEHSLLVTARAGRTSVGQGRRDTADFVVGGFDVLECADDAEATAVASRHPMAAHGVMELIPFWPMDEG